ncbi:unnamed protein product [Vitrella brassicaformis CCMP3155]|uniref:Potassium channel tetramerisation-type BTB domain-containing protein n=1 Tax=Vitrella brassicaformis (strain CCMP3155) TaxID=1169540 RepID=A0A0G4H4J8_VITBC|nr:unnamed protein product [Vitrella brassicaformis CCMP3155]|eukprot:CEM38716.1 unnamed protein product [Vitrella brassicaformis CCMP3155]
MDRSVAPCPERAILNSFHRPAVILCESLNPQKQEITTTKESTAQLKTNHRIADTPPTSGKDVLLLNVGGTERRVRRQHLTEGEGVEGTALALLFSGKFDERFVRDGKKRIFLDMDCPAFDVILQGILEARALQQATSEGGRDRNAVSRLLTEADKRQHKGTMDSQIALIIA